MQFSLTEDQVHRIRKWEAEQDAIVLEGQLKSEDPLIRQMAESGAYYGAIGGSLTYSFTPTSLGVIETVKHAVTKAELNLTDFESW